MKPSRTDASHNLCLTPLIYCLRDISCRFITCIPLPCLVWPLFDVLFFQAVWMEMVKCIACLHWRLMALFENAGKFQVIGR